MLLVSNLQQFDIELPYFLLYLAGLGGWIFFILAAFTTPLLAAKTETSYLIHRKAFYDKCAMQVAQSSGILLTLILLLSGAAYTVLCIGLPGAAPLFPLPKLPELPLLPGALIPYLEQMPLLPQTLTPFLPFIPGICLLALVLLYLGTWRVLKKVRSVHILLAYVSAFLGFIILFIAFLLTASLRLPSLMPLIWTSPTVLMHVLVMDFLATPELWLALATLYCLGMTTAGSFAVIWLVVRRNRADYGRDYYTFAMRYLSRATLAFLFFETLLSALFFWLLRNSIPLELSQPEDPGIMLVAFVLPLCCMLLWFSIAKSETPMRNKFGAFFAVFFQYLALCAKLIILNSVFPPV